jgi:formate dehydrogenase subunit gamma
MPRPSDAPAAPAAPAEPAVPDAPARILRFTRGERWIHHATAALMGVCLLTAAFLYVPGLAQLVGRRRLVVTVHEWSGLLLPAPLLFGLASRAFRSDLRRLNRFGPHDRQWLRVTLLRRHGESRKAGKFNAGQKVYAAWTAGAVLVMLGTGLLMWFTDLTPLVWRTSATFVHDWLALALGVAVIGHIAMALADPEARRGIRTGTVDPKWARNAHPLWQASRDQPDPQDRSAHCPPTDR